MDSVEHDLEEPSQLTDWVMSEPLTLAFSKVAWHMRPASSLNGCCSLVVFTELHACPADKEASPKAQTIQNEARISSFRNATMHCAHVSNRFRLSGERDC